MLGITRNLYRIRRVEKLVKYFLDWVCQAFLVWRWVPLGVFPCIWQFLILEQAVEYCYNEVRIVCNDAAYDGLHNDVEVQGRVSLALFEKMF